MRLVNVVIYDERVAYERAMKAELQRLAPLVKQVFVTMGDEDRERDDVLYVKGVESHIPGIIDKTLVAMRRCLDSVDFDYLIRSNISTVIDFARLDFPPLVYGSTQVWFDGEPSAFASGTNIVLSHAATALLVSRSHELDRRLIDDVAIGAFFARYGVPPRPIAPPMVWDADDEAGVVFRNRDHGDASREADVRRIGAIVARITQKKSRTVSN